MTQRISLKGPRLIDLDCDLLVIIMSKLLPRKKDLFALIATCKAMSEPSHVIRKWVQSVESRFILEKNFIFPESAVVRFVFALMDSCNIYDAFNHFPNTAPIEMIVTEKVRPFNYLNTYAQSFCVLHYESINEEVPYVNVYSIGTGMAIRSRNSYCRGSTNFVDVSTFRFSGEPIADEDDFENASVLRRINELEVVNPFTVRQRFGQAKTHICYMKMYEDFRTKPLYKDRVPVLCDVLGEDGISLGPYCRGIIKD